MMPVDHPAETLTRRKPRLLPPLFTPDEPQIFRFAVMADRRVPATRAQYTRIDGFPQAALTGWGYVHWRDFVAHVLAAGWPRLARRRRHSIPPR